MRLAILAESPADASALGAFVQALWRAPIEILKPLSALPGWSGVLRSVAPVLKHLHYREGGDGLVVAIDSNDTAFHGSRSTADCPDPTCRLCRCRREIARVRSTLTAVPGRALVRTAVGMPVPAIEAWWLAPSDPRPSEATWIADRGARRSGHLVRSELKTPSTAATGPPGARWRPSRVLPRADSRRTCPRPKPGSPWDSGRWSTTCAAGEPDPAKLDQVGRHATTRAAAVRNRFAV